MLESFLVSQIFAFILIFCRVGSTIMILPAFGETYIPPSMRLAFSFMLSLVMMPLLTRVMPALPASGFALFLLVASEVTIGLFIGTICAILISATHLAGMIFAYQSGMSSAVVFDVTQNSQGSLFGNFMGLLALVLLFSTGLHHMLLHGITDSYAVFAPGKWPPLSDFVEAITRTAADTFVIGVQLSSPLILVGTLMFLGGGILSRLMPTMQVFYVITAPQLLVTIFVLATTFSAIMLWFIEFYREKLLSIFAYMHT